MFLKMSTIYVSNDVQTSDDMKLDVSSVLSDTYPSGSRLYTLDKD